MSMRGSGMRTRVQVPKLGETSDVVVVETWLIEVGEPVTEGSPIVSVQTDKVVVDVVSPADGVLVEILVQVDDEARTGDDLCVIEQ